MLTFRRNKKVVAYMFSFLLPDVQSYRYFRHKKQTMIWDGLRAQWCLLGGIECGATCAQLHATGTHPPSSERRVRM